MKVVAYWILVLAALAVGTFYSHIPMSAIYDPSAAALVFLPVVGLLLCRMGVSGALALFGRMLRLELTAEDHRMVDQMNAGALLLAGVAVLIGMIHVMRNLSNIDTVGPGVALAFVALIYGALVPVLLLPFNDSLSTQKLVRRAAVFAFVAGPACVGVTLAALHVAKVF